PIPIELGKQLVRILQWQENMGDQVRAEVSKRRLLFEKLINRWMLGAPEHLMELFELLQREPIKVALYRLDFTTATIGHDFASYMCLYSFKNLLFQTTAHGKAIDGACASTQYQHRMLCPFLLHSARIVSTNHEALKM